MLAWAWLYTHPAPRIVRVDMGEMFDEQKKRLAEKITPGMSEQEQKALFQSAGEYASKVEAALSTLSKECGCVVMNSAAILRLPEANASGIPDMTHRLRDLVGQP
jgi:hypothetical protein